MSQIKVEIFVRPLRPLYTSIKYCEIFLRIVLGKEEVTGQLNQDNSNLYTLLKKIEKNIVNVEKVIQQTDKKNERLEGNSLIFKLNYI